MNIYFTGITFVPALYRQFLDVKRLIVSDMADEKRLNISIGAGINVSNEDHSSYIEIRKCHQSALELPYEPKCVNLDKTSLNKLINLSEELMRKIES